MNQFNLVSHHILIPVMLCMAVTFSCIPADSGLPENQATRPSSSFENLRTHFADPDMIYAPFAFWFWDTRLDTDRVAEMARRMCDEGLNPGYVHPRVGLPRDEWLAPVWFRSMEAALEEARSAGMYLGFCDEYWWPSGRADGRVLQKHPDLQAVSLRWESSYAGGGQAVEVPPSFFTVAARLDNDNTAGGEGDVLQGQTLEVIGQGDAFTWTPPEGRWKVYVFHKYFHPGWDRGDVNYLDKRLAGAFIDIAHKPYLEMEEELGRTIPGVFVDHEGDYGWKLAWSDDLEKDYLRKTGKDIRRMMPLMIDKDAGGIWVTARHDWYDVVSDIYATDFFGVVSDYLDSLGMYTISNLWEETLFLQAATLGDAFKAHRAVTLPGNDCLFEKGLQVHDFKEIQSVTEFEGRRFQSEVLGAQGWQMTPLLMKQVANAVTCWGVSHVVPHGINLNRALDSIPYPADWYTSNPYWPYLRLWNDFVRRASYINSHGYTAPDILLLNPMGSVWPLMAGSIFHDTLPDHIYRNLESFMHLDDFRKIRDIDRTYSSLINELTEQRIEFLIADEHYLQQMKVTRDGTLGTRNHRFTGIVLPDLFCLEKESAAILVNFINKGGKVYYCNELPAASAEKGLQDPAFLAHIETIRLKATSISESKPGEAPVFNLQDHFSSQISFQSGGFRMHQLHRIIDGRHFFWLVNNSGDYRDCKLRINGLNGKVSKWDCEDGRIQELYARNDHGGSIIPVSFKPWEAFWLVMEEGIEQGVKEPDVRSSITVVNLEDDWKVNVDPSAQPEPFKNQVTFPQYAGIARGTRTLTPWESWGLKYFTGYVDYEKDFVLETLDPDIRYFIDLGEVHHTAEVMVNGTPAGGKMWPPFVFDITDQLTEGSNHIKVRAGNTMYNMMRYYYDEGILHNEKWVTRTLPAPEEIRSGMFGPVKINVR